MLLCVCVFEGINECMYSLSVYIESMFICLAYNTVYAAPCGTVTLSNSSLRHSQREKESCFFLLLFKVTFSPYHSILLKYPDIVPPYI